MCCQSFAACGDFYLTNRDFVLKSLQDDQTVKLCDAEIHRYTIVCTYVVIKSICCVLCVSNRDISYVLGCATFFKNHCHDFDIKYFLILIFLIFITVKIMFKAKTCVPLFYITFDVIV